MSQFDKQYHLELGVRGFVQTPGGEKEVSVRQQEDGTIDYRVEGPDWYEMSYKPETVFRLGPNEGAEVRDLIETLMKPLAAQGYTFRIEESGQD